MILKIVDSAVVIAAVQVYENNYDGAVSIMDTFHCKAEVANNDTIFGTNDAEVVICIRGD